MNEWISRGLKLYTVQNGVTRLYFGSLFAIYCCIVGYNSLELILRLQSSGITTKLTSSANLANVCASDFCGWHKDSQFN